jgi:hypothetical protein
VVNLLALLLHLEHLQHLVNLVHLVLWLVQLPPEHLVLLMLAPDDPQHLEQYLGHLLHL